MGQRFRFAKKDKVHIPFKSTSPIRDHFFFPIFLFPRPRALKFTRPRTRGGSVLGIAHRTEQKKKRERRTTGTS